MLTWINSNQAGVIFVIQGVKFNACIPGVGAVWRFETLIDCLMYPELIQLLERVFYSKECGQTLQIKPADLIEAAVVLCVVTPALTCCLRVPVTSPDTDHTV